MSLLEIYNILLQEYRFQLWWPTTPASLSFERKATVPKETVYTSKKKTDTQLKPQYMGGPNTDKQRLEVAIGAILTQNTSWKNVEKAIISLNQENLIDTERLKKINLEKLQELIKPSGFYKQKAERLKIFADFLSTKKFPDLIREELLKVNGIGPETADSILLYACNKPYFVVDAYTKRIFLRSGLITFEKYDEIKDFFEKNLSKNVKLYQEFHALIVEHAKRFCKKEPECINCPLNKKCNYYKQKIKIVI